ncbi:hypothetical protein BV20DRAFT_966233 [Pilatotrama ljubarskyi]|nr:hypothetical protein BV20DRAFT_966233 [Pilatotrama ljubarskyi]
MSSQKTTAALQSGHTYRLSHARTRTVLDLSMKDWSSVKAAAWDASDNQKWVAELAESGSGWTLRNVATGLYLGVDGTPRPGAPIVATRQETFWDLQPTSEPSGLRLAIVRTGLCVQLGDARVSNGGVKLGDLREGGEAQQWRLEKA